MTENQNLICESEQRREKVRESPLYGLDYLEVGDDQLQLTVFFLRQAPEGWGKENVKNLRIEGGRRVRNIKIAGLEVFSRSGGDEDDYMIVTVEKPGDSSSYKLSVVDLDDTGRQTDRPYPGFDPRYSSLEFTFKAGGVSELDCKMEVVCPPQKLAEPEINYLAKDYASFRQLILDRLAVIMPGWQERHVPDIGVALVEMLAYMGDHLSYYQDAVATEAYLDTACQRISVRRHARLMDYHMHEGCNARTWVTLSVSQDLSLRPNDFYFITDPDIPQGGKAHDETELLKAKRTPYQVFEALVEDRAKELRFYKEHNEIRIYTWGDEQCCLDKNATSAILLDTEREVDNDPEQQAQAPASRYEPAASYARPTAEPEYKLTLREGEVVIFEEVKGAKTGETEDADPSHRHAVRLTKVTQTEDPLNRNLLLEIEWAQEDALPFPLCISSIKESDCSLLQDVSLVRGNVLLVDHGETVVENKPLGPVPAILLKPSCDECDGQGATMIPGSFTPQLLRPGLVFSEPLTRDRRRASRWRRVPEFLLAATALKQNVRRAVPQVILYGFPATPEGSPAFGPADLIDPEELAEELSIASSGRSRYLRAIFTSKTVSLLDQYRSSGRITADLRQALVGDLLRLRQRWESRPDLLESDSDDRYFVVEMDNDRRASLRFGDGELGQMPDPGMMFQVVYRIGDGPAGNVGSEALSHIVFRTNLPNGIEIGVRNPLAAAGGSSPEPLADVKLFAPVAFRKELQRAITARDYAEIVMRDFKDQVQRAVATLEWTGSRYEVQVAIDPIARKSGDEVLLHAIERHLYQFRKIGHDLRVVTAVHVPLEIHLIVHVLPHYLRGYVEAALLGIFSNRLLPDGRLGFFHADKLTFGEGIYLSQLIAVAQAVPGVESVEVAKLERLGEGPDGEIERGILPLGPLEIAQLDNDPNFPERGLLTLEMKGGR